MTKHREIFDAVQDRIVSGDFRPGDRIPTDLELVQEFGVSRPTVARAIQELERRGMVLRRPGSGTFVQKVVSPSKLFGLLIPRLGETEIFSPICGEMARIAQRLGHSLIWGGSAPDARAEQEDKGELALALCHQYVEKQVAGVFFTPLELTKTRTKLNEQIIREFSDAGIAVILIDRDFAPYPDRSAYDLIGIDNRRAGYLITDHIIARGAKRIALLAQPHSAGTIDARIAGYAEALINAGRSFERDLVHRRAPDDLEYIGAAVREQEIDAIVCGNDATAARLLHSLDALGISVPDCMIVGGIDDVRYAELLRVSLTTVHQPCAAIGDAAFRAMIDRIENPNMPPRDILINCHLVIRESTNRGSNQMGKA